MSNKNWYYLCNLTNKTAIELTKIPEVWGNISGMLDLSDTDLADLTWSNNPNFGFLTEVGAAALNITTESLQSAKLIGIELAKIEIRAHRDILLQKSDYVFLELWVTFTPTEQAEITTYRQALRDLTASIDIFNVVYPTIPTSLAFLNAF